MIIAPDWTTLKGIVAGVDAPDLVKRKQALQRTLNTIADSLPDVHAVRLYDIDNHTVIVRAATDLEDMTVHNLSDYPRIQELFDTGASLWQPAEQQWLCPLMVAGQRIGLLEVLVEDLDDEWITWLEVIATQLAPLLGIHRTVPPSDADNHSQLADRRVKRLVHVSQMLIASEDYDEAATAAMYVTEDNVIAVMMTIFTQPFSVHDSGAEGITNNRRYVAAVATSEASQRLDQNETISPMPELSYIPNLRQEIPIVLDNVRTEAGYLTSWMREQATIHQAQQIVAFGLVAADQVVGTLDILYKSPYQLTEDDINIYTTLAKEIGATVLSKRLLQRSLEAQQFASQLVTTNKALAMAESYNEMTQAVLTDAPDSVRAVAVALFNRPFTLMGSPVSLRTRSVMTYDGAVDEEFVDHFSVQDDARVTYFLHEFLEGRMMLLWNIVRPRKPVMAGSLIAHLQTVDGVDQITAFGLNVRNSLRGLVLFAGDNTLRDPGPQYDGLRTISDQLAAVIENRNLLQQTSEALDLIQSQYETSSRVFRTNHLGEILQAIYDFTGVGFDRAELAWTDSVGVTRVLAEAGPDGNQEVSRPVDLMQYPAATTLSVLEALEVRNVDEDPFVDEQERQKLQAQGIKAMVILPILTAFQLTGLIMFTKSEPIRISPDRLRAMRSLADQVSVVLQNRNLLQSMEMNLSEIQMLYEANRAMLRTQDIIDVLRVLRTGLAPQATICQIGIEYDPRDRNHIIEVLLDCEIVDDNERILRQNLPTSERERRDIYNFLRAVRSSVMFSPTGTTVPNNPLSLVQDRYQIESHAAFVITDRGQVTSLIYLLFDTPKPFQDSTRRLYEAIGDQVGIAIDNQKLLRESQTAADKLGNQVKALQTISGLAIELSNMKNEQVLLHASTQALVESLKLDHSGVVLFNEDMQSGVVVAEYPDGKYIGTTVTTKDNPILSVEHDITTPFVIHDVKSDDRLTDEMRGIFLSGNISSIIILPLIGQSGDLIGSVGLDVYDEPRRFDETEIQTAQTIAAQMAVGLQNVRLLHDAQARAEQLQHISDFSSIAQSTLNLSELVEATLENVPRLLDANHMTVALYDEVEDVLVMAGGWTENNTFRTPLDTGAKVPIDGTTTGYVQQTGEYLYIPDVQRASRLRYPHSRTVISLLAMPLLVQGRHIGVISVGAYKRAAYTETDIAVFQQLVNQMAVAMDNARTYTQSQDVARNKTLANDIALKLQSQSDIQQMVNVTMNEVGRALGAKRGRLHLRTDATPPQPAAPDDPDDSTTEATE